MVPKNHLKLGAELVVLQRVEGFVSYVLHVFCLVKLVGQGFVMQIRGFLCNKVKFESYFNTMMTDLLLWRIVRVWVSLVSIGLEKGHLI